jgi:hypothetical protein
MELDFCGHIQKDKPDGSFPELQIIAPLVHTILPVIKSCRVFLTASSSQALIKIFSLYYGELLGTYHNIIVDLND